MRTHKVLVDPNPEITLRRHIERMTFCKERRDLLLKFIFQYNDNAIAVNRRYCFNLNKDKDLQQLVEKEYLQRYRTRSWTSSTTYVQLTDKALAYLEKIGTDIPDLDLHNPKPKKRSLNSIRFEKECNQRAKKCQNH